MKLSSVYDNLFSGTPLSIPHREMDEVRDSYEFLKGFVADKVIYGINTGFEYNGTVACRWQTSP